MKVHLAREEDKIADGKRINGKRVEIFYGDETESHLNPYIAYMWSKRGEQPKVPTPGINEKLNVIGAMNPLNGEVLYRVSDKKNAQEFLNFIGIVVEYARRKNVFIELVLDNSSLHTAKIVDSFLNGQAVKKFLKVIWLPPYSPELNKIERFWRHLKSTYLANILYKNKEELRTATIVALNALRKDKMHLFKTVHQAA